MVQSKIQTATPNCLYTVITQEGEENCSVLLPQERKKYSSLPERKKRDWLLGRVAAKKSLVEFLRKNSELLVTEKEVEIVSDGPPYAVLHGPSSSSIVDAYVSIAHSADRAVAQVGDSSDVCGLGVDIERIRSFSAETLQNFLTEREYKIYQTLPVSEQAEFGTRLWCLKEAYTKACGVGLLIHPKQLEILQDEGGHITITHNGQDTGVSAWWTKQDSFYILATITL